MKSRSNILSAPECDPLPRSPPWFLHEDRSTLAATKQRLGSEHYESLSRAVRQRGLFRVLYNVSEPAGSGSGVANNAGTGWPKKLGYGCELIHTYITWG